MLPSNIDLTSHGDFGINRVNLNLIPQTPLDYDDDSEDGLFMSTEEYEAILRYEKIFGKKKRHKNEKFDIFPNLRKRYFYEEDKEHCIRCGKVIRLPWKNYYGLCEECDGITAKSYLPWDGFITAWMDDKGYNLFNLR